MPYLGGHSRSGQFRHLERILQRFVKLQLKLTLYSPPEGGKSKPELKAFYLNQVSQSLSPTKTLSHLERSSLLFFFPHFQYCFQFTTGPNFRIGMAALNVLISTPLRYLLPSRAKQIMKNATTFAQRQINRMFSMEEGGKN